jgi:hypothetical protein
MISSRAQSLGRIGRFGKSQGVAQLLGIAWPFFTPVMIAVTIPA